jgi:hypothetical protein
MKGKLKMKTKLTLINEIGKKVTYGILTDRNPEEDIYTITARMGKEIDCLEKFEPEFYKEFYSEEIDENLHREIYTVIYNIINKLAEYKTITIETEKEINEIMDSLRDVNASYEEEYNL